MAVVMVGALILSGCGGSSLQANSAEPNSTAKSLSNELAARIEGWRESNGFSAPSLDEAELAARDRNISEESTALLCADILELDESAEWEPANGNCATVEDPASEGYASLGDRIGAALGMLLRAGERNKARR